MALQTDNLMLLDVTGIPRTIDATDEIKISNDFIVGGDLTVDGDIVSVGVRDVVVTDNFIDMNNGNISSARSGGLTIQIEGVAARSQALDAGNGVTFESIADSGGANARFKVDGVDFTTTPANAADRVSVNDIIQISGLSSAGENNGLFVVKSIANAASGGWVEIKNVGEQNASTPFTQTEFESATEDIAGSLVGWSLNIGVITISDGSLPDGDGGTIAKGSFATAYAADADDQGSSPSGFEYGDAAAVSLQEAYDEGNTITTNGNPIAFTLTNGSFTATGNGSVNLTPTGASSFTSGGALTLTGGAASTWSTGAGALTLTSAAACTWSTSAGLLTLSGAGGITNTSTGGTYTVNAAGQSVIVDGAVLSLDGTDDTNLTMTASDNGTKTLLIKALNTGAGTGKVEIDSDGEIEIDATGAIGIDSDAALTAGGASVGITSDSGALTLTSAVACTWSTQAGLLTLSGAGGITNTSTGGTYTVDAAGQSVIVDGAVLSLDGTDDTNLTMTADNANVKTLLIKALNSGAGTGKIEIDADGEVEIDAGGAIGIDSDAALSVGGASVAIASDAGNVTVDADGNDANPIQLLLEADNDNGEGLVELRAKTKIIVGDSTNNTALIQNVHWTEFKKSAGFVGTAGVNLAQGDAVYVFNDGGTPKLGKAEADNANEDFRIVIGLAAQAANANAECAVQSVPGTVMLTSLSGLAAANIGDAVYLSGDPTTAGGLTMTAPPSSGSTVFRVGYVYDDNSGGNAEIIFAPQFIAKRP